MWCVPAHFCIIVTTTKCVSHVLDLHYSIILQDVQRDIKKMIEEAAPQESDEDSDFSDDTVEGMCMQQPVL